MSALYKIDKNGKLIVDNTTIHISVLKIMGYI